MRNLVVVLAVVCATGVASQNCAPDCSDRNQGDWVENPNNCTEFYICLDVDVPSDHALPCDPGNKFDAVLSKCVPMGSQECESTCKPATCQFKCDASVSIIGDMCDCNKYHVCNADGTVSGAHYCPFGLVFDGDFCVQGDANCCINKYKGSPWCDPGVIEIPDPNDCRSYYVCINEEFNPDYHFSCKAGEYFDIYLERCTEGTECPDYCNNGGGIISTTDSIPPSATTSTDSIPPSATTSTSTTTTTTKGPGSCINSLTCPGPGYYAKCDYCSPDYFECHTSGASGAARECDGVLVFNPDPQYPYCILPGDCPYSP